MEKKDIKDFSLVELKAAAYDQSLVMQKCQQNLQVLNERITKMMSEEKPTSTPPDQPPA